MLAVTVGTLLTLVLAMAVVLIVALPDLRAGSRILTPTGKQAVVKAGRQMRYRPSTTAQRTWHRLVRLRLRVARAWAPVSEALHEAMDRLEGRDTSPSTLVTTEKSAAATGITPGPAGGSAPAGGSVPIDEPITAPAEPVVPVAAEAPRRPMQTRFDVDAITYKRSVGRPRSMPADSGPIPVDTGSRSAAPVSAQPVIDLRDSAGLDGAGPDSDAEQHSGSVRHAR